MSIDTHTIYEMIVNLKQQMEPKSKELGYNNILISYNQTLWETQQLVEIYVHATHNNLLRETSQNKRDLRKTIPKTFNYEGLTSKVIIEFEKLPSKVNKHIATLKKHKVSPAYLSLF